MPKNLIFTDKETVFLKELIKHKELLKAKRPLTGKRTVLFFPFSGKF